MNRLPEVIIIEPGYEKIELIQLQKNVHTLVCQINMQHIY